MSGIPFLRSFIDLLLCWLPAEIVWYASSSLTPRISLPNSFAFANDVAGFPIGLKAPSSRYPSHSLNFRRRRSRGRHQLISRFMSLVLLSILQVDDADQDVLPLTLAVTTRNFKMVCRQSLTEFGNANLPPRLAPRNVFTPFFSATQPVILVPVSSFRRSQFRSRILGSRRTQLYFQEYSEQECPSHRDDNSTTSLTPRSSGSAASSRLAFCSSSDI